MAPVMGRRGEGPEGKLFLLKTHKYMECWVCGMPLLTAGGIVLSMGTGSFILSPEFLGSQN